METSTGARLRALDTAVMVRFSRTNALRLGYLEPQDRYEASAAARSLATTRRWAPWLLLWVPQGAPDPLARTDSRPPSAQR